MTERRSRGHRSLPTPNAAAAADFGTAVLEFLATARRTRGRLQTRIDDISVPQLIVMDAIDACGSQGISAVAAYLGLSQPTVTRSVAMLERQRLVGSEVSVDDARVRRVFLTTAGNRTVHKKRQVVAALLDSVWSHLDAAEQASAAPLLRRLAVLVDELM